MKHKGSKKSLKAEYLSVVDAEIISGLSRWTWRAWAYSGRIASVKVGRRLLIPATEIHRIIAEGTRPQVVGVNDPS